MLLRELGNMSPSRSSLDRLPKHLRSRGEQERERFEDSLRAATQEVPAEAATLVVSLDGVMAPMKDGDRQAKRAAAQAAGQATKGPAGFREVGCSTVSCYDGDGERLGTLRIGRMPEANKAIGHCLSRPVRRELPTICDASMIARSATGELAIPILQRRRLTADRHRFAIRQFPGVDTTARPVNRTPGNCRASRSFPWQSRSLRPRLRGCARRCMIASLNGTEFLRRVRRYARKRRLEYRFDRRHGKGSHGRVHVGGRFSTVPRKELGKGLLAAMLKDLGIDQEDF